MRVTFYPPIPRGGPWIVAPEDGDPVLVKPAPEILLTLGDGGVFEVKLTDDGWRIVGRATDA